METFSGDSLSSWAIVPINSETFSVSNLYHDVGGLIENWEQQFAKQAVQIRHYIKDLDNQIAMRETELIELKQAKTQGHAALLCAEAFEKTVVEARPKLIQKLSDSAQYDFNLPSHGSQTAESEDGTRMPPASLPSEQIAFPSETAQQNEDAQSWDEDLTKEDDEDDEATSERNESANSPTPSTASLKRARLSSLNQSPKKKGRRAIEDRVHEFLKAERARVQGIFLSQTRRKDVLLCPVLGGKTYSVTEEQRRAYHLPAGIQGTRCKTQRFIVRLHNVPIFAKTIGLHRSEVHFEDPRDCAEVILKLQSAFDEFICTS